jgi:hypothetical protein
MPTILRPVPDLRERVWGGRRLGPPRGQPIGEAWVAGPASLIADGPDAGRTLAEVADREGAAFVGRNAWMRTGDRFPLLVKLLDPAAWLSIQVHPDDVTARRLEGPEALGKTEAWYVLDAAPDSELIVGVRGRIGEAAVRAAMAAGGGSIVPLLARFRPRAGDAVARRPRATPADAIAGKRLRGSERTPVANPSISSIRLSQFNASRIVPGSAAASRNSRTARAWFSAHW